MARQALRSGVPKRAHQSPLGQEDLESEMLSSHHMRRLRNLLAGDFFFPAKFKFLA